MGSSYKNHFSYLGSSYKADSIEDWDNFQMDNEGHLVSMKAFRSKFQLSNESIEHLSNFPHLRTLRFNSFNVSENVTNFGLLSKLSKLSLIFHKEVEEDLFKDLGLFSNLISLRLFNYRPGNWLDLNIKFRIFFVISRLIYNPYWFFQYIQFGFPLFKILHISRFFYSIISLSILNNHFFIFWKIEEEFPSCFQSMTRLTNLVLIQVRRSDPEPIPFPTQFCNMIYLQRFFSDNNNFSGYFEWINHLII